MCVCEYMYMYVCVSEYMYGVCECVYGYASNS